MKKDAKTMKEVAEDYAKQLGVDFVCVSADDDVTKQNIVRSIALAKQANADALTLLQRAYLALTARITQSQMSVILIFTQKS